MLSRRHDVVLINVNDPVENNWTLPGNWNVVDAETLAGGSFRANTAFRRAYAEIAAREHASLEKEAARAKAGWISLTCGEDIVLPLTRYFDKGRR